jgi:hypothetical protein
MVSSESFNLATWVDNTLGAIGFRLGITGVFQVNE